MAKQSALINVMVKAAMKAARGLTKDFGEVEQLQVSRKGPADFVSAADIAAQNIIRDELAHARPTFGFLMEEEDKTVTADKPERWIIDPLDGTTNFLHGVPHWSISIGAERDGELIAGVIYAPVMDELFWAEKGLGAYGNNKRLRVSSRKDLADCLIGTGIPFKGCHNYKPEDFADYSEQMARVMPKVAGIRRIGSAALDLAYTAAGRFDGFWERNLKPWDVAAGIVLVREAGGFVYPLNSKVDLMENVHKSGGIIATNAQIYNELSVLLRKA